DPMKLTPLVGALDDYFRVGEVRDDFAWSVLYPPYWRDFVEPGYEARWNGLLLRGAEEGERAAPCVFPSDRLIAGLRPGPLPFSEHAADWEDERGFLPLARVSFERMRERGISFYQVHLPLDVHPAIAPSRLCALGVGLRALEDFFAVGGLPGG